MAIYRSPFPSFPLKSCSLWSLLLGDGSSIDRNHPAYVDANSGKTLTRNDVRVLSLKVAYALECLAFDEGDVAMIFSPNTLAWPVTFFGILAAGMRVTPATALYTSNELAFQLMDSRASLIFVHPTLFPVLQETLKLIGVTPADAQKRVVIMTPVGEDMEAATDIGSEWMRLHELLSMGVKNEEVKFDNHKSDDTALLCYTSGTTGLSKSVNTSHKNLVANLQMFKPTFMHINPNRDVMLSGPPFYHIYGLVKTMLFGLYAGMPVVIVRCFEPSSFCLNIERYQVTFAWVVPPSLVALSTHPAFNKHDMTSLRALGTAAAPLHAGLVNRMKERFSRCGNHSIIFTQGYGLTETSPTTHFLGLPDADRKFGTIGTLLPMLEARLVDDDGIDVPTGSQGEMWIRGPTIMKGYLRNPIATKDAITPDKWFKTGDIMTRDAEGYFRVVGRKKELIKYKGFRISPADLEAVLLTHPEIEDVGVIGIGSAKQAAELPCAFVVPKSNLGLLSDSGARVVFEQSVQRWVEGKVAQHNYLRGGVAVIDEIPKNISGKILRAKLKELAMEAQTYGKASVYEAPARASL